VSLRHVSALKGPSSGSKTDAFRQKDQQTYLPDVKCSIVSGVQRVVHQNLAYRSGRWLGRR